MNKIRENLSRLKGRKIPVEFIIAFIFDIVYGMNYYSSFEAISLYDTSSYFDAADKLVSGRLDLLRTPVYSLFLHACRSINAENVNQISTAIQVVFFYISIIFFWKLMGMFTDNRIFLCFGTILYGCMTPVVTYNMMMLTESFAVSGTVIYAYFLIKSVKEEKMWPLTVSIVLSIILTMTRPSLIYLFVVDAAAIAVPVVKMIKKKGFDKKIIAPAATLLACICLLLGYMRLNLSQNGYFGLSYVSDMNKFYDVAQADIWRDNSDTEIRDNIQRLMDEGASPLNAAIETELQFRDMINNPSRIKDFNNEAITNHKSEYNYYTFKKVWSMGYNNMEYNLTNDSYFLKETADRDMMWIGDLLDFNINYVYFIFLLSAVIIIQTLIKQKRLLLPELIIALVIGGQLAVNILAGPAEFHRLNATCYPFALMLVVVWAGMAYKAVVGAEREVS